MFEFRGFQGHDEIMRPDLPRVARKKVDIGGHAFFKRFIGLSEDGA